MLPDGTLHVRHYAQAPDTVPRQWDAYYLLTGDLGSADPWEIVNARVVQAHDGMAGAWESWAAAECRYLGATGHLYHDGIVYVDKQLSATGSVGGLSGDTLPDSDAAVISRYTDNPGPSGRGRAFIPCVAEGNTENSRLTPEGLTALVSVKDAMDADLAEEGDFGSSFVAALFIRKSNITVPVVHWITQPILVTQRRRRVRPLQ